MNSPIEDTKWAITYGSYAEVREAFDRVAPAYHQAIWDSGAPQGAARTLIPFLPDSAQGLDLGCGSGVLGMALAELGWSHPMDGIDISPGMLVLARKSGVYRQLYQANLLLPEEIPDLPSPYDFMMTMGLVGDYLPYYHVLPLVVPWLRHRGLLGLAVEMSSTPSFALARLLSDLNFKILAETELPVPDDKLKGQTYYFCVAQRS